MKEQRTFDLIFKIAKDRGFESDILLTYIGEDIRNDTTIELLYYTELQKWLREKHYIDISVIYFDEGYLYSVEKRPHKSNHYKVDYFDTFEQALSKAIQEALKLI